MPELPEVQTIVNDLNKKVKNKKILSVWTDSPKTFKNPIFLRFKKIIKGRKILEVSRRAKNLLFELSGGKTLLIHLKMTGHLLFRPHDWEKVIPDKNPLKSDPYNQYVHVVFRLNKGQELALSDARKFAKILLFDTQNLKEIEDLKNLGPEPLEKKFNFNKFIEIMAKKKGEIKKLLLDQTVIAGIGNIYSDEILWQAKIHPKARAENLNASQLKTLYKSIKEILQKGLKYRGSSTSDYRDLKGGKGFYQNVRAVYRRKGEPCRRCNTLIKRIPYGGRGAHFCPRCQQH